MLDIFEGTLELFDKRLLVLDGSVSLPSMAFLNDRDSGFYRIGANNIGLSLGGALIVDFLTTGIDVLAKIGLRKATDDAVVEKIDTGGVLYLWNRADAEGLQVEFANNALVFSATAWAIRAAKADASTLLLQAQNALGQTQTVLTVVGAATVANSYITAQVGGTWTLASGQTWTLPALTLGGAIAGGAQNITNLANLRIGTATAYGRLGQTLEVHTSNANGGMMIATWDNGASSPLLDFFKSDSDTIGTQVVVATGKDLGYLTWAGSDGTDRQEAGYIRGYVTGTTGDNRVPGALDVVLYTDAASSVATTALTMTAAAITWNTAVPHSNLAIVSAGTLQGLGTGANGFKLKNLKNAAATALSGTQLDVEIDIGGTPYYFTVYPTKA